MFQLNPCRTDGDTSNSFEVIKNTQKQKIFIRAFSTVMSCNLTQATGAPEVSEE
jgi:hypothetical protein